MAITFNKISVIGLGLIGTSILHSIKVNEDKEVVTYAYDINPDHRSTVIKMNIATFVLDNLEDTINRINKHCHDPTLEVEPFMTLTSRKNRAEDINLHKLSHNDNEEEVIPSKEKGELKGELELVIKKALQLLTS